MANRTVRMVLTERLVTLTAAATAGNDGAPLFLVSGVAYSREQMAEANASDEGFGDWLRSAKPGDLFPDGEGCLCASERIARHIESLAAAARRGE